jgi:hypothetical protein
MMLPKTFNSPEYPSSADVARNKFRSSVFDPVSTLTVAGAYSSLVVVCFGLVSCSNCPGTEDDEDSFSAGAVSEESGGCL